MRVDAGAGSSAAPPPPPTAATSAPTEAPLWCERDRTSLSNLRAAFRPNVNPQCTVRVVTPEPVDHAPRGLPGPDDTRLVRSTSSQGAPPHSAFRTPSASVGSAAAYSPGGSRRQGMVFNDAFPASYDANLGANPTPRPQPSARPRTHTLDSFSPGSLPSHDEWRTLSQRPAELYRPAPALDLHISAVSPTSPAPMSTPPFAPNTSAPSTRDRKTAVAVGLSRLVKKTSSRPSSPLVAPFPTIDALPLPVPTEDANKVLLLMRTLCGRMRGEVECLQEPGGVWLVGMCYIEDEKGCLMFDSGEPGSVHVPVIPDLRGCRVTPSERHDGGGRPWLEISGLQPECDALLRPFAPEELDLWLAALLCWQQLRPAAGKTGDARSLGVVSSPRPEVRTRVAAAGLKDGAGTVIKIGQVLLWDKGLASSPQAIVKRPSTRDLRAPNTAWRRVSCTLRDKGEFTLMTENDVAVISIIELSQLSRAAIQQLDKTVLGEEYCIAIFPIYTATASQLSIFRPVYISLESRVLFEVWFVLLRAFTLPEIYGVDMASGDLAFEPMELESDPTTEMFRMEKSIYVRVTEARIRSRAPQLDVDPRQGRGDVDRLVGNYLAEVVLDGEVRARTTIQTDTKTPFWREDCNLTGLPPTAPYLSIILKRLDGNLDSLDYQPQASTGLPKTGNLAEVVCGSVDVPLPQLEQGRDHEQWLPVCDDRQQIVGSMLLKVHHEELVVLQSREYQPLSELLHRFSAALTVQITESVPGGGNLRRFAEIFLNIFQVSNNATEWLMNMVEDEVEGNRTHAAAKKQTPRFNRRRKSNESVDSASDRDPITRDMGKSMQGEANLLFRGNSLLTQALELQMRRLGKEYLENVLGKKLSEINELNPNCEVDPGRTQPGEDIEQHWQQLLHLTTELWECIASSAKNLPPELRRILKHVRTVAEYRYGDFLHTVTYTSVSGFIFLRFICPAILNPKLFGLLRDHPRPRAQRTLTLMAKGLQALANLSPIGKKETWMEPMNNFLTAQRQPLKDFLDAICAISVERTNVILPASYSTPITILGRLSPLAREGFPSLPYLIDHACTFATLVKLWTDCNPPDANGAEKPYEGDLKTFHETCVALQQRANTCLACVESSRLADLGGQMGDELLGLSEAVDYLSVHESPQGPGARGGPPATLEQCGRPAGSSDSDLDVSAFAKDGRFGDHDPTRLHQDTGSNDVVTPGGTIIKHSLRHGKHARRFLSGFIRKRTTSPVPHTSTPAWEAGDGSRERGRAQLELDAGAEKKERKKAKDRDKDRDKEQGRGVGSGEAHSNGTEENLKPLDRRH